MTISQKSKTMSQKTSLAMPCQVRLVVTLINKREKGVKPISLMKINKVKMVTHEAKLLRLE